MKFLFHIYRCTGFVKEDFTQDFLPSLPVIARKQPPVLLSYYSLLSPEKQFKYVTCITRNLCFLFHWNC